MPGLPDSAYSTLGGVFSLVRSLLNDVAGSWASDAVLLPYANSAYRTVNSELGNVQAASYIKDNLLMVLPAVVATDPSIETVLNDSGFNNGTQNFQQYKNSVLQLPPDLLVPLRLWERTALSSEDFREMEDVSDSGGLPSEVQGARLRYWEWRQDGLYMPGSTQDEQIRMRYEAAYMDMPNAGAPLLIRNGQNAVAFKTAELASTARTAGNGPGPALFKALYTDEIELLKNRATQREQHVGRRRRPYSGRRHRGIVV